VRGEALVAPGREERGAREDLARDVAAEAAVDARQLALRPEEVLGEEPVQLGVPERAVVLVAERRADDRDCAAGRVLVGEEDVRVVILLDRDSLRPDALDRIDTLLALPAALGLAHL
jgi:hypothetical protein